MTRELVEVLVRPRQSRIGAQVWRPCPYRQFTKYRYCGTAPFVNSIGKIARGRDQAAQVGLVRNLERYFADAERDVAAEAARAAALGTAPARYWTEGERVIGMWVGSGAAELG